MLYKSTRSTAPATYTAADVIKEGLASDGGLFVPESIPVLTLPEIEALCRKSYPERAADILSRFLIGYTEEELLEDCRAAYSRESFAGGAAPLVGLRSTYPMEILELWHGPTAACKDMALQIMPRLLSRALTKTGETRNTMILVATSGDTGKAALEGYRDMGRMRILVFYPSEGVSIVQKLQMETQQGSNVQVCAIRGNFDDTQNGVKEILNSPEMTTRAKVRGTVLTSANSINWGRLVPQTVYYISAYCDLINAGRIKPGARFNVCVPAGNFGNIFAAYITKSMGLPIERLVCASNSNNALTEFLNTGVYDRNRTLRMTMSPSMDVLISDNLERLLFFIAGSEKTAGWMQELKETGKYTVDSQTLREIRRHFVGYCASEEETSITIRQTWRDGDYLADPHTAVAIHAAEEYLHDTGDTTPMMVLSTASPFKFAGSVYKALTGEPAAPDLEALDQLAKLTGTRIPYPLAGLGKRPVRFSDVCDVSEMRQVVMEFIKRK